ncbi:MAG: MBL fold metallo-hydrolase [Prevotella sp.]|nr:MBL fold metallo-hydrolase [Prevotella sp.]
MINIRTFVCNMLQENCYIVSDDSGEAVVIDCGAFFEHERQAVVAHLRDQRLTLRHVLCTHGHFDHVFGNDTLYAEFGVKPEIHADDLFLVEDVGQQYRDLMDMGYSHPTPPVGTLLTDGATITFGHHRLSVIHTPGHSPGGVVFHCAEEHVAFTGDTLFRMSVGRTDLTRGSWEQLMQSLQQRVALLPADTTVYPGHGPITTIADEQQFNPYLR